MKSNLKHRIIPTILFYNYMIVKSRGFGDYRTVGNLEQTVEVYNRRKVDELIILDIGVSKQNENINIDVLNILSKHCLMPVTYGGGIKTQDDIAKCLFHGCDKVLINSAGITNKKFIAEAVKIFGSQCIVSGVDFKLDEGGHHKLFSHSQIDVGKVNLKQHLLELQDIGIGEFCLTSVDQDGWMNGYEIDYIDSIRDLITVPIILGGGAGNPKHMVAGIKAGASAVAGGSIFLYSEYGYADIKKQFIQDDIPVRIQ